jgi:hypothetical protein
MTVLKKFGFVLCLLCISECTLADTIFQKIKQVNYNGDANYAYFVGDARWGDPGCANATYVSIGPNVSGRKEILSIGLAAYMAGKKVQFWGQCAQDKDYFEAMYIVVINE